MSYPWWIRFASELLFNNQFNWLLNSFCRNVIIKLCLNKSAPYTIPESQATISFHDVKCKANFK